VAAGLAALAAAGASASAQVVASMAREHLAGASLPDKGVAVVTWNEPQPYPQPPRRWVYTAGYVTENDAQGNPHTRLAVYKHSASYVSTVDPPWNGPPPVEAAAFFPPTSTHPPAGQHAATDMTVDDDGNIYVVGYTTLNEDGTEGSDRNYLIIKYDKNLAPVWGGTGWGEPFARGYDGTGHGDDVAVSVARTIEDGSLFVTGTSLGMGTGDDIVTLYYGADGTLSGAWPDSGEGPGIRRYDGAGGSDTAAEVGYMYVVPEVPPGNWYFRVYVVGTSYQGPATGLDFLTLAYGRDGRLINIPYGGWIATYDRGVGGEDHGTGLEVRPPDSQNAGMVVACGYSATDAGSPPTNTDYTTVRWHDNTGGLVWVAHWDGWGLDDVATDIAIGTAGRVGPIPVWVTGRLRNGLTFRAGTIAYNDVNGAVLDSDAYTFVGGADFRGAAVRAYGVTAWVCGEGTFLPGDDDTMTIEYETDLTPVTRIRRVWVMRAPDQGGGSYESGAALIFNPPWYDVFVCGEAANPPWGQDLMIMRIIRP
jgi:hypothetical protein